MHLVKGNTKTVVTAALPQGTNTIGEVEIRDTGGNALTSVTPADGLTNGISFPLATANLPHMFNETTWDRVRNNTEVAALASALRSASTATAEQTSYNAAAVFGILDITARTVGASPLIRVELQTNSTTWALSGDFDPTTTKHFFYVGTGAGAAAVGSYNSMRLIASVRTPRRFLVYINHIADVTNLMYSLTLFHLTA